LADLREEVRTHPAVNHPFLARVAVTPFSKQDYLSYGLQHYPLVHLFTTYLERLLLNSPDSESKLWLARVLVDEYGEGSEGKDHPTLYRGFLRAAGARENAELDAPLAPQVTEFIRTHLRLSGRAPFLVGLGAVGPGHEWAIPHMFPPLIEGLQRAGFAESEIEYFTLHTRQDENHGAWLEEALARFCHRAEARAQVRAGTLASLEARRRFWLGVERRVVAWRQPRSAEHASDRVRVSLSRALESTAQWAPLGRARLRPLRARLATTLGDFLAAHRPLAA
jgi:pyrroloquinoline quinone (PQQ) biosynthesis protein C